MLLRYISHFGCFSKIMVFSENKKMISFTTKQYTKPLIILTRTVSQVTDVNRNICSKFKDLDLAILKYKQIKKFEVEDIINRIESQDHINNNQALSLFQWCNDISDCSPLDKVKLMESLWLNLTVCNFQLTLQHYNALLKVYVDNNYDFSPSDLLTKMKENQVYPDCFTYYMCVKYYCMKGNINEAILFLKCDNNIFRYYLTELCNALLIGYSRLGNIKSVENMLSNMTNNNIKPTTDTYAAVICTYAKLNDINKIKQIIHACHSHNMYFTNTHILRVIATLVENNHVQYVNTMYQYLKKTLKISNEEIQVILDVLNTGQVNTAINMLLRMRKSDNYLQYVNTMKIVLKYAVDINMVPNKIIEICNCFKYNIEIYKKLLLISLYYSLLRDNHLSLALLRACKSHCKIKSHYFWPLLTRNAMKYDFDGILNILDIMINEFNITPCVYTISEYVLSISFGNRITDIRNLLMKYKVNETVVNNAYVLMNLKQCQPMQAALYVQNYPDQYFYNILSYQVRKASVHRNDVESFINISCELLENTGNIKYSENILNNNRYKLVPASMDKQLYDVMIDFPSSKVWLKRVIECLITKNIRLKPETIKIISNFLDGYVEDNIIRTLENLSRKTV